MIITESRIRQIIRQEARQAFHESTDPDYPYMPDKRSNDERDNFFSRDDDDEEGAARPRKTVEDVINDLMDKGAKNWSRVSNDFYAMSDGEQVAQEFYPGLSASDFGKIARKLDAHFNY
jgi:hypothetical protein